MTIRNGKAEYAWTRQMEMARFREKYGRKIKKTRPCWKNGQVTANDSHIYDDDLTIKTTQVNEIYPKLGTFETSSKKFQININWGKIKIIIDEHEYVKYAMRRKLPIKYRGIKFVTNGALLGQQINLRKNQLICTNQIK